MSEARSAISSPYGLETHEAGFQKDFFPDSCPYSFDQILDEGYFPV